VRQEHLVRRGFIIHVMFQDEATADLYMVFSGERIRIVRFFSGCCLVCGSVPIFFMGGPLTKNVIYLEPVSKLPEQSVWMTCAL